MRSLNRKPAESATIISPALMDAIRREMERLAPVVVGQCIDEHLDRVCTANGRRYGRTNEDIFPWAKALEEWSKTAPEKAVALLDGTWKHRFRPPDGDVLWRVSAAAGCIVDELVGVDDPDSETCLHERIHTPQGTLLPEVKRAMGESARAYKSRRVTAPRPDVLVRWWTECGIGPECVMRWLIDEQ